MRKSLIRNFALAGFVLASGVSGVFAQPGKNPSQNPLEKPRNAKKEPVNKVYRDWISKDVAYIITKDERKAFEKLTTDEERENFIENFWRRRDPNPDTEENEYREEFYERIAYANEHFTSGIPGYKTDRGRIYITFGKPDSIESHPTGGAYDRPSYEGGGSTTTYPFEIWFYRHLDSVGEGIEIEFVDPTGTGEYRIARSPYEKDALAMVPGAGLTTAEQLGLSDKGQRNIGGGGQNFMREQDNPFRRMEIITNLQRPPQVKFSDLQANLESPVIDNNPLDFDLRVDFFRQSDERVVTAFTIQTDNKELVFEQIGGLETARMNIFGRITAVAGKRSGIFEDSVTTNASPVELAEAKERKSIYQKAIALAPGTYKVDVVVRDVSSGSRGIRTLGFTVPRYEADKLSASSLILASKLYSTTEKDIGGMFVVGNAKVVPNLTGVYKRGQEVGIYMQIYNAGIDQTTLRPSVDVDYVLLKDGKEVIRQKEDWQGMSDSGQRLTIARLLPTTGLTPGEYEIRISIRDRVNDKNKVEGTNAKFTIIQ
ncbi:MAG TPA: GWxTD domain-containing protein [Pyrinomonadaceae bacterium]|nr:GWxTD domain-containing protein [Pyrinomonadaceae bacterium]